MNIRKEITETREELESVNADIIQKGQLIADSEDPDILDDMVDKIADLVSLKKKTLVYLKHLKSQIKA